MSRFLRDELIKLAPYTPGEQPSDMSEYIKLNTNESPYPPSERALSVKNLRPLNRYCDTEATVLKDAVASYYGLKSDNIIVSNGSDEALAFCFMAFCGKNKGAAFGEVTYGFYPVFCNLFGIDYKTVPLDSDLSLDPKKFYGLKRTIFIANPNAQTGIAMSLTDIEGILKNNPDDVVILDEAYVDFGGETAAGLIGGYDNLVIVQTFSKSRNLAGARVGIAMANPELITDLNRIKYSFNPYNLNTFSAAVAAESVKDVEYFKSCVSKIVKAREYTVCELKKLGFTLTDSKANFILTKSDKIAGEELYKRLKENKVLVRHFGGKIEDYIRVTIGTEEEMKSFISAVKKILGA